MSLEQTLAANTAAIEALTAALLSGNSIPAPSSISAKLDKVEATVAAADKPKAAKTATSKAPAKAEAAPAPVATGPTYEDVKKITMDTANVAGTNRRDLVVKVLSEFGAKLATELKPEQYAAYIEKLTEEVSAASNALA